MMKMPRAIFTAAALLSSAVLSADENGAAPLPTVVAALPQVLEFSPHVMEIGETKAEDSVDLVARVSGYLVKMNFKEGAHVKKGTLLFEIDDAEYEAKVMQAKAELARAKATQQHDDAEYLRQKTLYDKNAISEKEYARYQSQKYESDASLLAKKSALHLAELDLQYTKVLAPFDGWMGFRSYSVGNMVGPQSGKLATIERSGRIKVDFFISEVDAFRLTEYLRTERKPASAAPVEIFMQDGRKIDLSGTLSAWDNKVNPKTGTLRLQAIFNDPARRLIPGCYVKVKLCVGLPDKRIAVRQSAVANDISGQYIFVLKNVDGAKGTVERRYIKPFASDDTHIYLNEGLTDKEYVVVSGLQKVRDGASCSFTVEGVNPVAKPANDAAPVKK